MNSDLDQLCLIFEDELERQQNVLALLKAQRQAALAHDLETMEARTQALDLLIVEAKTAERRRIEYVTRIVEAFSLPVERQTLTGLISSAPPPYAGRLHDFQQSIHRVLRETKHIVRENAIVLRRSLKVIDGCINVMSGAAGAKGQYGARGQDQMRERPAPTLLDRRG